MSRFAVLAVALAACDDGVPPPTIVEPAEGEIFDRGRLRARTNVPDLSYRDGIANGNFEFAIGAHTNWRVDGGEITEVQWPTLDTDNDTPFMFGVTVPPGTHELEVGTCDGLDACTWSVRDVTVTLRPGSPDADFAGSGQLVLPELNPFAMPTALSDGRLLISETDDRLGTVALALRDDGRPDPSFGVDDGMAPIPVNGRAFFALPDGGFLLLLPGALARFDADGAIDTSFGDAGIAAMVAPGAELGIQALAPRTGGGYVLAGTWAPVTGTIEQFVVELDDAGVQPRYVVRDPAAGYSDAWDVDGDGNVAAVGQALLHLDTASGPAAGFGTGGTIALPELGAGRAVFHDGGIALAQQVWTDDDTSIAVVTMISRTGVIGARVEVPFEDMDQPPLLASAPDGSLYLASTIAHPMEAASLVQDGVPGTDFAVARIRDGTLDRAYGDDGVAHASFTLARTPIVLETISDRPRRLTLGPGGAPWLTGLSTGLDVPGREFLRTVEPVVVVARFLP